MHRSPVRRDLLTGRRNGDGHKPPTVATLISLKFALEEHKKPWSEDQPTVRKMRTVATPEIGRPQEALRAQPSSNDQLPRRSRSHPI